MVQSGHSHISDVDEVWATIERHAMCHGVIQVLQVSVSLLDGVLLQIKQTPSLSQGSWFICSAIKILDRVCVDLCVCVDLGV